MSQITLQHYMSLFGRLHRRHHPRFGRAPHKPVLLLSVLQLVEIGVIRENLVRITPDLVATFRAFWRALVQEPGWQEKIVYPFRHLASDGFWELVRDGRALTSAEIGQVSALTTLESLVDGARLAPDLWALVLDRQARQALRAHLFTTYFAQERAARDLRLPTRPLEWEAERMVAEARAPYRRSAGRKLTDEDGAYVRRALFAQVVTRLYHDACAVCRLDARDDRGSTLIDAAHIMPYTTSGYDDLRNGLALCPNHRAGLDRGWFSVADDYSLLVSPRVRSGVVYVTPRAPLYLPDDDKLRPAPAALKWHRENMYLGG